MRLLDLFCGEGLGAWGYWNSGRFSEIVGIDKSDDRRSRYSFDFICCDALKLDYDFLMSFDFIHASPPCQAYSHLTRDKSNHERLITGTRLMLEASGIPFCIENVEGAIKELRPNVVMDGHYFGLPSERRRYFYVSTLEAAQRLIKPGSSINIHSRSYTNRSDIIKALGLDEINAGRLSHISRWGMKQGIPPVMTKHIAGLVFPDKFMIGS